ncbi:MAG: hypothetical protein N2112_02535 [Gemmataceae bacterium]|jgi:hypothetical protein|nr:hypothetical protein [Gemmataceae bacterium]
MAITPHHAKYRAHDLTQLGLNQIERQFVEDLKKAHDQNSCFFERKELYLLRNLSQGRGVGFFEAGNFHPDFNLWLLVDSLQHVIFVAPKGIRNLGPTDPKIQFHQTIKEIETRLSDTSVRLHSFIVSNTPSHIMKRLWDMEKQATSKRHILFHEEDKDVYIHQLFEMVLNPTAIETTS